MKTSPAATPIKKKEFSYNYSPHGRACHTKSAPKIYNNAAYILKARRQERKSVNAQHTASLFTEDEKIAEQLEEQQVQQETPEYFMTNQEEREYQKYLNNIYYAQQDQNQGQDQDQVQEAPTLLLKLGEVICRPRHTYSYKLAGLLPGIFDECVVREIEGEYLVVPVDILLDYPEYVENDDAWQDFAIGYLTNVIVPSDPFYLDIEGEFVDNETQT